MSSHLICWASWNISKMLKSFALNQNKITKLFSLQKKKRKETARTIALMIEELLYEN